MNGEKEKAGWVGWLTLVQSKKSGLLRVKSSTRGKTTGTKENSPGSNNRKKKERNY
jgi:hypothetical protein